MRNTILSCALQNNILRQITTSVAGSGKILVICGFRAGGARAQLSALHMQSELHGNYMRMLDMSNKLPNKCWTRIYGVSFGGPKFIGKVVSGLAWIVLTQGPLWQQMQ